jgi:hypothetical protein
MAALLPPLIKALPTKMDHQGGLVFIVVKQYLKAPGLYSNRCHQYQSRIW